jgi:hypothetical protein
MRRTLCPDIRTLGTMQTGAARTCGKDAAARYRVLKKGGNQDREMFYSHTHRSLLANRPTISFTHLRPRVCLPNPRSGTTSAHLITAAVSSHKNRRAVPYELGRRKAPTTTDRGCAKDGFVQTWVRRHASLGSRANMCSP